MLFFGWLTSSGQILQTWSIVMPGQVPKDQRHWQHCMPAYQLLRRFLVSNNQLKIKRYPKAKRFQLVFESKVYLLGSFTITHDTCCVSFFFWNQKRILSIALINYTLPLTPCHCFALILFMARRKVIKFFSLLWFWFELEYISRTL